MRQAGVSTHSGDGETSCRLRPMIDFARKVRPQPFVERREGRMHARLDRIAWPRKPGVRLGERLLALRSVECKAERYVVARRLPGQQGIVLEEEAELRARKVRLDRA